MKETESLEKIVDVGGFGLFVHCIGCIGLAMALVAFGSSITT